jgi:hypothetical protein
MCLTSDGYETRGPSCYIPQADLVRPINAIASRHKRMHMYVSHILDVRHSVANSVVHHWFLRKRADIQPYDYFHHPSLGAFQDLCTTTYMKMTLTAPLCIYMHTYIRTFSFIFFFIDPDRGIGIIHEPPMHSLAGSFQRHSPRLHNSDCSGRSVGI